MDEYYPVVWVEFTLGPFDLELSYYGPGRKWEEPEWKPFCEVEIGEVFETRAGKIAVKINSFSGLSTSNKMLYFTGDEMVQADGEKWGE